MGEVLNVNKELGDHLKQLHLPAMRQCYEEEALRATQESLGYAEYLLALARHEYETRRHRRTERLLRESRLPLEKSLSTFELDRLPTKLIQQVKTLLAGHFLDNKENVLAFGNPGSGKTHLLAAICQELVRNDGRRIYFTTCQSLVEDLLNSKQELKLDKAIKKLAKYDALFIDDVGYVQQSREEMEVLFTLLAERYERGSMMITSNLPFSKWENIFKDPMTTAAAIDRLVHHSVILEINLSSYRMQAAKKRTSKRTSKKKTTTGTR